MPIQDNCVLGRTPANQVVLTDERVSRRHATIHAQGEGEFWLVDLGSSNGTYVNHLLIINFKPDRWPPGSSLSEYPSRTPPSDTGLNSVAL